MLIFRNNRDIWIFILFNDLIIIMSATFMNFLCWQLHSTIYQKRSTYRLHVSQVRPGVIFHLCHRYDQVCQSLYISHTKTNIALSYFHKEWWPLHERDFTLLNTKLFNCDDDIHYNSFVSIWLKKKKCKFSSVCKV